MKLSHSLVTLLSIGLAAPLAAQSAVEATQAATPTKGVGALLPDLYSSMEARHYYNVKMDKEEVQSESPSVQGRLNIGSKFFEEKLDAMIIFGLTKNTDTVRVQTRQPELVAKYYLVKTDLFKLTPNMDLLLPHSGTAGEGYVAVEGRVGTSLASMMGDVRLDAIFEPAANVYEKKQTSKVEYVKAGSEYALVESPTREVETRQMTVRTTYGADDTLAVAAVTGLNVGLRSLYNVEHTPKYAETETGDTELKGYEPIAKTETRFLVSYQLSDKVNLSNTLYHQSTGFYEASMPAKEFRYLNRVILSYTLL